jgi:hypothetical protein
MIDHQQDLKNVIEIQKNLINEINELNTTVASKKELVLKYQGIIEYLTSSGVTLPESEEPSSEIDQTEGE